MPDSLDLTAEPLTLLISLTRGEDFVRLIEPVNPDGTLGTFTLGDELVLDFGTAGQWPAIVTVTAATWNVDAAVNDALMDAIERNTRCALRYRHGTVDRVWAIGWARLYG